MSDTNERRAFADCPYCANPDLFKTPVEQGARPRIGHESQNAIVAMHGKVWRRDADRHPRLRSFPEFIYSTQRRFRIEGKKEFIERFARFTVDVIGVELNTLMPPAIGNAPFFHRVDKGAGSDAPVWRIYNACRINPQAHLSPGTKRDEAKHLTIDAHYWITHGLIISVRNLHADAKPYDEDDGDFLSITQEALEFFRVEKRGQPKVTESKLIEAIQKVGEGAMQTDVARELDITDKTLRTWLSRFGLTWEEAKRRYQQTEIL